MITIGYSDVERKYNTKKEAEEDIADIVIGSNFEITVDFIECEEGEISYDAEWSVKLVKRG